MPRRIRGANVRRQRTLLRQKRKEAFPDHSARDIAKRFDMSEAQLSRIERALSPYTQDFLELAACAYGIEPADLLPRKGEFWDLWNRATPEQQKTLMQIAKAIIKSST